MPTWSEIAIVVLTWNGCELTLACLHSLAALDLPVQLIVVDNGSTDSTVDAVRAQFPAVTVLETGENLGYAGGNNMGIRHALAQRADYIGILNNDVTAAPDFLMPLVEVFQKNPKAGIVTPLIAEAINPQCVWALGASVDRRTGTVQRLHAGEDTAAAQKLSPFEVDVAPGAAMLVKKEIFKQIGLLDENFYLYYEEADWCLRAKQAGHQILAVPSSVVWHRVSATLGHISPLIDYYMLRNQLRFIAHHWPRANRLYVLGRVILRNLLTIAAYTAKPRGGQRVPHRNARLLAFRDATLGRWGKMGSDVEAICRCLSK